MRLGKVGAANYGEANKNPGEKNAESEGLCVVLALGTPGRAAGAALLGFLSSASVWGIYTGGIGQKLKA